MASKKSRTLFTVALIVAPLIAIVFLVAKSTPKTSPGMALVLKTLRQDAVKVKDFPTDYMYDWRHVPYRVETQEITYSTSAQTVADLLKNLKGHLSPGETIDGEILIPGDRLAELTFENGSNQNLPIINILFESDLQKSKRVTVEVYTPISQIELVFAELTGHPVSEPATSIP